MPQVPRVLKCDIATCGIEKSEKYYGAGWPGWLMIGGITKEQVCICPEHAEEVKRCLDDIEKLDSINIQVVR